MDHLTANRLLLTFDGTTAPGWLLELIARHDIAGVTLFRGRNVRSPAQVRALTAELQAALPAGRLPLLVCADQEGGQLNAIGGLTGFPGNLALGAAADPALAERTGAALALELAAVGVNVAYAPVCDVNVNPRNPVIGARSFGEDPLRVAALCAAMVRGVQSAGVAATAKHFPGHGDTSGDSHHALPVVPYDRARLDAVELPPFRAAIEAGVQLVMTAHLALPALTGDPKLPATLAPAVIQGLLRGELGFGGVTVSDAMDMAGVGAADALGAGAVAAVAAGVDLLLLAGDNDAALVHAALRRAAVQGRLNQAELAQSAARIAALRRWVGAAPQPALDVVGCAAHQAVAAETARRAVTLVRDQAGLLPLHVSTGERLAVVVPENADLTPADTTSYERCELAEAIRRHDPGALAIAVPADPDQTAIQAALTQLQTCDRAIIATTGVDAQPGQAALVRAALASGVPTIVAALRLPYDLLAFAHAPTYVCSYSTQPVAVEALAAALYGVASWRGRLPVTLPGLDREGQL